jgi:hypothetical protein
VYFITLSIQAEAREVKQKQFGQHVHDLMNKMNNTMGTALLASLVS